MSARCATTARWEARWATNGRDAVLPHPPASAFRRLAIPKRTLAAAPDAACGRASLPRAA